MSTKHVLILAGWGASVAAMVASLPQWQDAVTPAFIGGAIGSFFAQVIAIYTQAPDDSRGKHDA